MSAPHMLDIRDWQSVYRHTLYPLLAGAAIVALTAGMNRLLEGNASMEEVLLVAKGAGWSALVAGFLRLVQRWKLSLEG